MADAAGREYSDYTVNEQRAYLKGAEDQKLVMEALADPAGDLVDHRAPRGSERARQGGAGVSRPISDTDAKGDDWSHAWRDLLDKDDRTSPEEYPDMCLITHEELREFMRLSFKGGLHQAAFILRSDASMAETSSILTKRIAHSGGDLFAAALLRSYANGLEIEADNLK